MRAWANVEEDRGGALWSSDLLRTEAIRSGTARLSRRPRGDAGPTRADRAHRDHDRHLPARGELDPGVLRSLDAIHLAAALSMGDDLEGIVTYDARFEEAALALGLPTIAP